MCVMASWVENDAIETCRDSGRHAPRRRRTVINPLLLIRPGHDGRWRNHGVGKRNIVAVNHGVGLSDGGREFDEHVAVGQRKNARDHEGWAG